MKNRFYYDKVSGDVFFVNNMYTTTTKERDLEVFPILTERNIETYDYIDVSQNQYTQNFAECTGYRVDVVTKTLVFSYPDPNNPEAPPVYQKPLTEQISEVKTELKNTQDAVDFLLMNSMPI